MRPIAPENAARLERELSELEIAQAREGGAPGPGGEGWARLLVDCHRLLFEARRTESELSMRLDADLEAARSAIDHAAARAATAPLGLAALRDLTRSRHRLAVAERLASAGRPREALEELSNTAELLTTVDEEWLGTLARFDDPRTLAAWTAWVEETIAESRRTGRSAVVVSKLDRRLDLYDSGRRIASYRAELGVNGIARKLHSGDQATPEGRYRAVALKSGGHTRYHRAVLIDYPNPTDRERFRAARASGSVPPHTSIGGLIEIHGHGGRGVDWTDGCVALTNGEMDQLFRHLAVGSPITIVGYDRR